MRKNKRKYIIIFSTIAALFLACVFHNTASLAAPSQDNNNGTYSDHFDATTGTSSSNQAGADTANHRLSLKENTGSGHYHASYYTSGYVITSTIRPLSIVAWKKLTLSTSIPANSSIKVQILDTSNYVYSDYFLANNSSGLSGNEIDLSSLPPQITGEDSGVGGNAKPGAIRIKFTLETSDINTSPTIDSIQLTWKPKADILPTASPVNDSSWSMGDLYNQQATRHVSSYNTATYPVVRWQSDIFPRAPFNQSLNIYGNHILAQPAWTRNLAQNVSQLRSINRDTGKTTWSLYDESVSSTRVITQNGMTYQMNINDDNMTAVDANTGELKWSYNLGAGHESGVVVTSDGTLYFTFTASSGVNNTMMLYAINPNGTEKFITTFANAPLATDHLETAGLSVGKDDTIYYGSQTSNATSTLTNHGIIFALNPNDGSIKWQYNNFDSSSAPIIDSIGNLYIYQNHNPDYAPYDKKLISLDSEGNLQWERSVSYTEGYRGWSVVSLRSDNRLFASLQKSTGTSPNYSTRIT